MLMRTNLNLRFLNYEAHNNVTLIRTYQNMPATFMIKTSKVILFKVTINVSPVTRTHVNLMTSKHNVTYHEFLIQRLIININVHLTAM